MNPNHDDAVVGIQIPHAVRDDIHVGVNGELLGFERIGMQRMVDEIGTSRTVR